MGNQYQHGPFLVTPAGDEPLLAAVERGMAAGGSSLAELPALTELAQRDPFFAEQLVELHRIWNVRPAQGGGLLARLRSRLAWRLLGPELEAINAVHACTVRVLASLASHLDDERAARARLEERLAGDERR